MNKIGKFAGLPRHEKKLYLWIAVCLVGIKAGLFLLPFERLRELLARFAKPYGKPGEIADIQVIIMAIERVGRSLGFLQMNCLPQALVGYVLLRRRGFEVQLKIGVLKTQDDELFAHAWLEREGQVILGDLRNLREFTSFPSMEIVQK